MDQAKSTACCSAHTADPIFWVEAPGHPAVNNMWVALATPAHCAESLQSGLAGPTGYPLARATPEATAQLVISELDRHAPELEVALRKARPWRRIARAARDDDSRP